MFKAGDIVEYKKGNQLEIGTIKFMRSINYAVIMYGLDEVGVKTHVKYLKPVYSKSKLKVYDNYYAVESLIMRSAVIKATNVLS